MAGYNYLDVNPKLDKWITDTETGALIGVRQCQEKTLTVWNISNSTPGVFTSSQLATALTDETGSGAAVFATSPTLVTPTLGVATATSVQGIVGNVTPAAGTFTALTSTTSTTLASESVALTANNLPTVRPTLLLDFANSKSVDPRITFTRASTATRINDKGLIETVASGAPRIDYDPVTLACKGLLIEESRTNLLTYSQDFDNAVWTKSRSSVSANATTAPDGTVTADKLVEDTSTNSHLVEEVTTVTSGVAYTYSAFVKAAERTEVLVQMYIGASFGVVVNLSTGAFVTNSGSPTSTSIQALPNGWYRVSVTATSLTTGNGYCDIYPRSGSTAIYTGDGTSGLYIWGAQLEAGSFATSYIPTTSAQVTRAADAASMTGTNFSSWYRQDEGTFVVEFTTSITTTSAYRRVIDANDGTNPNTINLEFDGSGTGKFAESVGNSTNQAFVISDVKSANTGIKAAFAYKVNDISAAFDGTLATSDTSASLPTCTQLNIGSSPTGSVNYMIGHIARIAYYPQRLPNATLQALSTP